MEIIKFPEDNVRGWLRREIRLKETPLKKSAAIQISRLTKNRNEPYHVNKKGYVLCVVVTGWMETHCSGHNYKLNDGEGIIFNPGERHRINKGNGWMISISSMNYESLKTKWE